MQHPQDNDSWDSGEFDQPKPLTQNPPDLCTPTEVQEERADDDLHDYISLKQYDHLASVCEWALIQVDQLKQRNEVLETERKTKDMVMLAERQQLRSIVLTITSIKNQKITQCQHENDELLQKLLSTSRELEKVQQRQISSEERNIRKIEELQNDLDSLQIEMKRMRNKTRELELKKSVLSSQINTENTGIESVLMRNKSGRASARSSQTHAVYGYRLKRNSTDANIEDGRGMTLKRREVIRKAALLPNEVDENCRKFHIVQLKTCVRCNEAYNEKSRGQCSYHPEHPKPVKLDSCKVVDGSSDKVCCESLRRWPCCGKIDSKRPPGCKGPINHTGDDYLYNLQRTKYMKPANGIVV